MHFNKFAAIIIVFFVLLFNLALAKQKDSIRVYTLGDINVMDSYVNPKITKSNINSLDYFIMQKTDVVSASELQMYIPSGRIRTNSRGESMLFLRGAGERQLGLFFDGVPLNIAWDNRFDLSLLPIDLFGKINVNKNANSINYGPNVLGGAVNISTIERAVDGYGGNLRLQTGDAGLMRFAAMHDGRLNGFNYITSISYMKSDGMILSANRPDSLTNQNLNSALRSNTDREFLSIYARGEYFLDDNNKIGLSVMNINGEKGVAPESHLEPENARFWRYPEWNRTIFTLNSENVIANAFLLRTTVWYDLFDQQLDTYDDISFSNLSATQNDDDVTVGARFALAWKFAENHSLSYVFNTSNTRHKEKITSNPELLFSQYILSTGLSYNMTLDRFSTKAGIVYDYFYTGKAGLFTSAEGTLADDYGLFVNFNYMLSNNVVAFANFSRRTRFPTMRESYSGALDRFIVNPDLQPETGLLNELGVNISGDGWFLEFAGFANLYDNLIEQIRLTAEQDPQRRRMRVNYSKAQIIGLDLSARFSITRNLALDANFTYMSTQGEQAGEKIDNISNRPNILSGVALSYNFMFGMNLLAELESVGKQYESHPDVADSFIEIGSSTILNARASYRLPISMTKNVLTELFIRVNNITDVYRLSQLGLPEAGRTLTAGISLTL